MNLDKFLSHHNDGVFYLGHASILIRLSGKTILCDPVGYSDPYMSSWFYYPPQVKDERFFNVDYVYISHLHRDHFDVEFLSKLSKNSKILILEDRVTFQRELDSENIDYSIVPAKADHRLCSDVFMRGYINTENGVDSSAFFYNDNFCVYHGNDHWLSTEEIIGFSESRKIDVACLPFSYICWYPFCSDNLTPSEKQQRAIELVNSHMDYAVEVMRHANIGVVIPFGSNLVHFTSATSLMNLSVKCPTEFRDYVVDNFVDLSSKVEPLHAGDFILSHAGDYVINKSEINSDEYRKNMQEFIAKQNKDVDTDDLDADDISGIVKTVRDRIESFVELDQIIRIEGVEDFMKLEINLPEKTVNLVGDWSDTALGIHHFKLDKLASFMYFTGKAIFDDIAGTRRFSLYRSPDVYCKETFNFSLGL